jgi:hypothetical protein
MVALVMRLLMATYGYSLALSTSHVAVCEVRRPGKCNSEWTQAFTISAGLASTLWAYVTESPQHAPPPPKRNPSRPSNASPSDPHRQRSSEDGA